jgi:hypothetical protein
MIKGVVTFVIRDGMLLAELRKLSSKAASRGRMRFPGVSLELLRSATAELREQCGGSKSSWFYDGPRGIFKKPRTDPFGITASLAKDPIFIYFA